MDRHPGGCPPQEVPGMSRRKRKREPPPVQPGNAYVLIAGGERCVVRVKELRDFGGRVGEVAACVRLLGYRDLGPRWEGEHRWIQVQRLAGKPLGPDKLEEIAMDVEVGEDNW